MRKIWVVVLALLALQGLQGQQGLQGPCSPCHCSTDILDCTMVELPSAVANWNLTGVTTILLEGSVQLPQLPQLPGVRKLSLRYNQLAVLKSGTFTNLPDLTELDLSHNQLTADAVRADVLRGPWQAASYEPLPLETLDLSYNSLHALPRRALEHLPRLQVLRLDHNPLEVLDQGSQAALAGATGLQVLGLSGCGLRVLPADLQVVLGGLRTLDLSYNQLRAVPGGLPTSLRRLDLDGNPIRRLPAPDTLTPPFLHLDSLEELSLSHMPLLEVVAAGAFFGLPRLRALSCTDNPALTDIQSGAFSHLGPSWQLTEVSLRNNSLHWLAPGLLAWRGLTFLDASSNPWHCSCNFSSWAASTLQAVNLNSRDQYRCSSPASLSGRAVWNVTASCSAVLGPRPSLLTHALLLLLLVVVLLSAACLLVKLYPLKQQRRVPDSLEEPLVGRSASLGKADTVTN